MTSTPAAFAAEHARWHSEVEARRTAPYGPLSVTALHWLTPRWERYDGAPGRWRAHEDGRAEVVLDDGETLQGDGRSASGTVLTGPLSRVGAVTWRFGDVEIEVAARSGSLILRVRDPRSRTRAAYTGTDVFAPDPRWVVDARFVTAPPIDVEVDSAVAGKTQHYESPGSADFEIDGIPLRLVLFDGSAPGRLRALFADTSEHTFGLSRSVDVVRTGERSVRIDFNRATNPPCAYSDGATCPFPPPANRLPVPIDAGERMPAAPAAR